MTNEERKTRTSLDSYRPEAREEAGHDKLDLLKLAATSDSLGELIQLMDHDNAVIRLAAKKRAEELMKTKTDILPELISCVKGRIFKVLDDLEKTAK